jgi:thymidylate synthase
MKLNFSLDDLEKYINDDILEAADNLDTSFAMKGLRELEKGLWAGKFDDDKELVETEVLIQGSKVKSSTCECISYQNTSICGHVVMTMIAVRRRRQLLKEGIQQAKQRIQTEKEQNPKLTTTTILKKADINQLLDFIADYARNDKQFALALKARFAGDVMTGNIAEHYKTLIDNTLKSVKNTKGKITPKGWLQVFTMLDELRQKADAYFKTGELYSSYDLIQLSLPLLHRLMRSSDGPKVKLEKRQLHLVVLLRGFTQVLLSPELSDKIWILMTTEYALNARHPFAEILFEWLLTVADKDIIKTEKLLEIIENQLNTRAIQLEERDRLLTQKIQVLQKAGRVEDASRMILSLAENPDIFTFAIQNAIENGDLALAKSLCLNGLNVFKRDKETLDKLETALLIIAQKQKDTEGIVFYAEKCFLTSLDTVYYDILKHNNITKEQIENIIQSIENQTYRIEKRDALAYIFTQEKQYDRLEKLITELQSLELLRRFGVELWHQNPTNALNIHKKIIYEYLSTHLGRPPAMRIRSVLEKHLADNGKELAERLIENLKNDFPERYSLKEELDYMMEEFDKKKQYFI